MSKEAMKLALEALEVGWDYRYTGKDAREIGERAMKSLREALAEQPEPLPVKTYSGGKAWHVAPEPEQQAAAVMPCGAVVSNVYEAYEAGKKAQPAPVQQCMEHGECFGGECIYPATQPAQQEPVAIHQFRKCGCSDWYDGVPDHHNGQGPYEVRTLYTTPQAQPAQSTADKSELETVPAKGGLLPAQQEPVAEVKAKMTGGNVGIATVIHEIHSPIREPLQPGDKLYAAYRWVGWDVEQVWSERIFGIDMRFENVQDAIAFRKKLEEATTPQAQPAREPLTDEQILEIKAQFVWTLDFQFGEFARAIEAAHGITKGGAA